MEEIPLPSSPDSPGPPGDDNREKEVKVVPGLRHELDNPEFIRPESKSPPPVTPGTGDVYSPSMVTSSPEYETHQDESTSAKETTKQDGKSAPSDNCRIQAGITVNS